MKCNVSLLNSLDSMDGLHPCFSLAISEITQTLAQLPSDSLLGPRQSTAVIRDHLDEHLVETGWATETLVSPQVPIDLPHRNYIADAQSDHNYDGCTERHLITLEFCFDNRQAIGTNLLKFEKAAQVFKSATAGSAIGLLITADRDTLRFGGWDPGIACADEYDVAIRTGYAEIINSPIAVVTIRSNGMG